MSKNRYRHHNWTNDLNLGKKGRAIRGSVSPDTGRDQLGLTQAQRDKINAVRERLSLLEDARRLGEEQLLEVWEQ